MAPADSRRRLLSLPLPDTESWGARSHVKGTQSAPATLDLDGPSDLQNNDHPNVASFRFCPSSSTPPKATEQSSENNSSPTTVSALAATLDATTKPKLKPCQRSQPKEVVQSASEATPSVELKPSFSSSHRRVLASIPEENRSNSHHNSPKSNRDTPAPESSNLDQPALPRSKRKVVRQDNFWLKRGAAVEFEASADLSSSPFAKESAEEPETRHGCYEEDAEVCETTSLAIRAFAEYDPFSCEIAPPFPTKSEVFTVKAADALHESFQPVENSRTPDDLSDTSGSVGRSGSVAALSSREDTPRITRALILKKLWSEEDLRPHSRCCSEVSYPPLSPTMNSLHPDSAAAMTEHRREAVRLAHAQERVVVEKCRRSGQETPGYTFDELIGKGSFGRVYKGRQTSSKRVVAIKVLDIDEADFQAHGEAKDEQIRDFNREIRVLRQAQESGAPNMNQMIEAFPVHSQLWLICEYCPGGSVKTLMRATKDRLAEEYIVVVARELAKALKGLHDAGIMHRDVKAANVLVHEEGRIELCDFGVAGVLEQSTDKRRTFIGTLHWMPPELWSDKPEYSDEVDVWEFGVTLYECALGKPPNADLRERKQLQMRMRRLKQAIALPENEDFSESFRSLIQYTLNPVAKTRPSMKDILEHEYLADTEDSHPTSSLTQLVQSYYQWLHGGGHRASLFMPGGAVVSEEIEDVGEPADEWNFSTTDGFDKRNSVLLEVPSLADLSPTEDEVTPRAPKTIALSPPPMNNVQKQNFDARVQRGADLSNLFDQEAPEYEYKVKKDFVPIVEQRRVSDLPFRAMSDDRPSSIASNVIDLGDFDSDDYAIAAPRKEDTIQLADAATIRARRSDSKGPRGDSRGPRERSASGLAASRTASADDLAGQHIQAQDFAASGQDQSRPQSRANAQGGGENGLETTPVRDPGRKTMDWTFATAVPMSPEQKEEDSPPTMQVSSNKNAKHATMEWSFSNAYAEVGVDSSQEVSVAQTPRSTPRRAPLLRTMTQPVTFNEVHVAEEMPRPSTSHSEAFSESSASSADGDPFALERGQHYPDPTALDTEAMSDFYATRGRSMQPSHVIGTIPYQSTVPGPTPHMYGGAPARIGDEGFPATMHPAPNLASRPTPPATAQSEGQDEPSRGRKWAKKKTKKHSTSSSRSSASANGTGFSVAPSGRFRVDMPPPIPPDPRVLSGNASNEQIEGEFSRLLDHFREALNGASQAVGHLMRPRRKSTRDHSGTAVGLTSGSEWEDEE